MKSCTKHRESNYVLTRLIDIKNWIMNETIKGIHNSFMDIHD